MKGSEKILQALKAGKIDKDTAKKLYMELQNKEAPVLDEMHPDIDFKTRAIYKNFGNDPEASFNYLQKKLPNLNFKKDASGNVLAKKPEEREWRRLDEKGFGLQDISDSVYDIGSGFAEGTAAVLGGLAAGTLAIPSGPGAVVAGLTGGAAAGAAAGGGLEALRQKIGTWSGIDQDLNYDDIKTSSAFGAVSPILLGTGAGSKVLLKEAAKKLGPNATKEAVEALAKQLGKTQRGLLGQTKDAVAPRVGEQISGIKSKFLKRASENIDSIDDYDAVGALTGLKDEVFKNHSDKMSTLGTKIGDMIDGSNASVDIKEVRKEYLNLIKDYSVRAKKLGTDKAKEDLAFVKKAYNTYVPKASSLDGQSAISLKKDLNDLTRIKKVNNSGIDTQAFKQSQVEKDLARISKKAAVKLDDSIGLGMDDGGALKAANKEYSKLIDGQKTLQKYFKDEDTTKRTLGKVLKGDKVDPTARKIKDAGVDGIEDLAESIKVKDIFADPDSQILSLGKSATGRNTALQAAGILGGSYLGSEAGGAQGAAIGGTAGAFVGALGSPKAFKAYMKANARLGKGLSGVQNLAPDIAPFTPRIQSGVNIWKNLNDDEGR